MTTTATRFVYLLGNYSSRQATVAEMEEFFASLALAAEDPAVEQAVMAGLDAQQEAQLDQAQWQQLAASILAHQPAQAKVVPMRRAAWLRRMVSAAAVVLLLLGGFWIVSELNRQKPQQAAIVAVNDIMPGKQRATLTLADGRTVVVENNAKGILTMQGNTQVANNHGTISYQNGQSNGELQYNVLTTGKGEKSGITFGDGTIVYVDAATRLRYPVNFTSGERVVELLEGQAYFEVAHDGRPFMVKKGNQVVQVLGTHFNVMAYDNEAAMKVTLVEGRVKVINGRTAATLLPGGQAVMANSSEALTVNNNADLGQATAWIKGQFAFRQARLSEILRELERWYDITVEVHGQLSDEQFVLDGSREATLASLLRGFDVNHIPYRIDAANKKLIVNP